MDKITVATGDLQELSASITPQEVVQYMNRVNPDAKCSYCQKGEYGVGYSPDGKGAVIIATPAPGHEGLGLWYYPAACVECGHTIFFNALTVAKLIRGKV